MLKWIKIRRNSQKSDGILHKTPDARWKNRGGDPAELRESTLRLPCVYASSGAKTACGQARNAV